MSQIVVPAATKSVITPVAQTTFQVGTYTALTDAFTKVVDLNDHVSFWLVKVALSQPEKVYARTSTIRAAGERITAWNYKNRHITLTIQLLYQSGTTALLAAIRALLTAIENPPYRLAFAPPNAGVLTYADVVAVKHTIPTDAKLVLAKAINNITIDFECAPGFSGDRITLSNLVVNPGFEAPSGPPLGVFADTLATLNAYTASGGALTQDVTTYSDVVMADAPIRYYRLDESAGPTVYDASLSSQNGTGFTGIGFLQTGALNGSTDTAASFNGTTGYVDVPTTGLPTGNAAWTLEGWFKTSASGINGFLWDFGTNASKQGGQLYVNSANKLVGGFNLSALTSAGTVNNGAWHHAAVTWDGTNLTLYLDGAVVAGPTSGLGPGAIALNKASVGQQESFGGNFFNGTLDEMAVYATALSSTRILAHYNVGHNAPASAANTMKIPAGASAMFGSPAWGSINQWQVRFRYNAGMTAFFNAHAPGGSNTLGAEVGGGTLYAQQTVAGTQHILGSASFTTVNELYYWLVFTQFPCAPGTQCDVQATIYRDNNGALGAQVASTGAVATYDGVTALSGQAAFNASGAALGIGGAYSGVNSLWLFGPGGWGTIGGFGTPFTPTGLTSCAWDQSASNTYPGGAVTSYGAARMDLPPVGSVNAVWESYSGGAPAGTSAIPTATGNGMAASAYVKSSGLSGTAALSLQLREWDASGNLLRATTLQSVSGNHSAWTTLSGSATIGATTAYCSVLLQVSDATAGASAGGVVWWDNTQCWNQTTTGLATMPYCELRFPQSPAQLLLTGVQGDMVAPAFLAWGTFLTNWPTGATLSYAIGRRSQASANARLAAASVGFYGAALSPTATAVLDASSYGGYYLSALLNPGWNPRAFSFAPSDALGVYHLFSRAASLQSMGNLPNVQTRMVTQQKTTAWYGSLTNLDQIGAYYGPYSAPLSASSTWTPCDSGQANVPALPVGTLTDLTLNYLTPRASWADTTGGGSTLRVNWQMLLPVDGAVLLGMIINPANAPFAVTTSWLWSYLDGLVVNQSQQLNGETLGVGATYSVESAPTPTAGHAGGGQGTSGTGVICINNNADPYLTLDPGVNVAAVNGASGVAAGGAGINQLAGYIADNAGTVLPLFAEVQYTPLYLYPREQ